MSTEKQSPFHAASAPPSPSEGTKPKTMLPGVGRPLNYVPQETDPDFVGHVFPSALSGHNIKQYKTTLAMVPLRELTMMQLMNSITDKPDWYVKVTNAEITQKWKEEALSSGRDITQSMVDYCIAELQYKASLLPEDPAQHPPIIVYNGDVVKSDVAVSPSLKKALQEAVKKFEAKIPERLKDWHPGSDGKVWDLVHPSLFPLIYGRTRVLADGETLTLEDCVRRSGEGEVVPVPGEEETMEWGEKEGAVHFYSWQPNHLKRPYSARFQWLPCEVDISGPEARITTYINNLHPEHEKSLYTLIEKLITASIPLWDRALAPLTIDEYSHPARIYYDTVEYDPDPESAPPEEGPQQDEDEEEDEYYERRQEWIRDTRRVKLPEPGAFEPLEEVPGFSLRERYGGRQGRGLQVVVKMANVELTSEKPEYAGGSWHVEGQMNEHIVATSIYYYSSQNTTPCTLSFRQQCNDQREAENITAEQHQHEWLARVFGCEQDAPAVQEVGGVETREGRLVAFPNVLQHKVGAFGLVDRGKHGHRKIVALFLVDPGVRVVSTAHVPCQQQGWWWGYTQKLHEAGHARASKSGIARLPLELQDRVLEDVDFPISLEEAKRVRLELMEERKDFVVRSGKAFESSVFSLCEH